MRYYKRLKQYKASNMVVDLENQTAHSYGWWCFWTVENGVSLFNSTFYSQSTCGHQSKASRVIDRGHDLVLRHTKANLTNPAEAVISEINGIVYEIEQLTELIKKPRTHKAKNEQRRQKIEEHKKQIEYCQSILMKLTAPQVTAV